MLSGSDISVVIPYYNQPAYLHEALQSVVGQDVLPGEIIIVDDASEEEPAWEEYSGGIPIRYIRNEQNMGVSAARNRGIRAARGAYTAFLDADDVWMPWHLSSFLQCREHHGKVDFYSGEVRWFARKGVRGHNRPDFSCRQEDYFSLAIRNARVVHSSSVILSRALMESIGMFDERMRVFEDMDMWIRAGRTFPLWHADMVSVAVRLDTPGSLSKNPYYYHEDLLQYFFDKHLAGEVQGAEKRFIHQNILGSLLMYKYYGQKPPAFLEAYLDTQVLSLTEKIKKMLPAPLFRPVRRMKRYWDLLK